MVLRVQAHQNFRIAGADHSRIAVGQIDARVGQSNVVQHIHDLALGQILMQKLFDLVAKASGFFHAQTRAAAQVQPNQAGINGREEILAQEEYPAQRQQAEREKDGWRRARDAAIVVSSSW